MDLSDRLARRGRGDDSGIAALEFALVLPILLALILGIISIGHGMVVRYVLSSAAYDAARACSMERTVTKPCATAIVLNRLTEAGGAMWCNGPPNVDIKEETMVGLTTVRAAIVEVDCAYRGVIGQGFLQQEGFALFNIKARASMPY